MRKRILATMALVAVAACESGTSPAGPNPDFTPTATIVDGGTTLALRGVFYFEEPLQVNPPIPGGAVFDDDLQPEVRITGAASYDRTFPFGKGNGKVKLDGNSYKLNWDTGDLEDGDYNVQVLIGGDPIGAVDLMIDGRDASVLGDGGSVVRTIRLSGKKSRTIPVAFWLGEGAEDVAEHVNRDCFDGAGAAVIDCDATTVPSGGNSAGPIEVFDLGDVGLPPAAKVIIDPNMVAYSKSCLEGAGADLNDPATWPGTDCPEVSVDINLFHLAALSTTPSLTHYPFYVGLDVFTGGSTLDRALVNPPLQFILCQAESVEDQLGASTHDLNIGRLSGGTTSILQTSGDPSGFCVQNTATAFGPAPADASDSFLGDVLRRVASAATAWVAPTPLHATAVAVSHGGLRAALPGASEFFATLGEPGGDVVLMQGGTSPINTDVVALPGSTSVEDYYAYGAGGAPSASSNIDLAESNTSLLYIYDDGEGGRSLIIVHDAPHDGSGGKAEFLIEGRQVVDIQVFDDPQSSQDSYVDENGDLRATWVWNNTNTDGAAIDLGLATSVTITPSFPASGGLSAGQITSWKYLTGDLANPTEVILDLTLPVTISVGGGS